VLGLEAAEAAGAADEAGGAENSATTSIIHPKPLTPTSVPGLGVRMVTLDGMF
jgi:hypothetical protein